jgi:hypothetical protein
MSNEPYHNQGFGVAFLWIILVVFLFPLAAMMTIDDTWDRFLQKYFMPTYAGKIYETYTNRIWLCRQSST